MDFALATIPVEQGGVRSTAFAAVVVLAHPHYTDKSPLRIVPLKELTILCFGMVI
jgi:hypothetical protein